MLFTYSLELKRKVLPAFLDFNSVHTPRGQSLVSERQAQERKEPAGRSEPPRSCPNSPQTHPKAAIPSSPGCRGCPSAALAGASPGCAPGRVTAPGAARSCQRINYSPCSAPAAARLRQPLPAASVAGKIAFTSPGHGQSGVRWLGTARVALVPSRSPLGAGSSAAS